MATQTTTAQHKSGSPTHPHPLMNRHPERMPLTTPVSDARDASSIAAATAPTRDRAIDVARIAALVVVMFGHCALLLATIDSNGLWIGNLLGAVPALTPITWVLQVMPLFFLAGGAAGAYAWRDGTPWGTWLFTRTQRLCRPVFWYLAAWALGLVAVHITLGSEAAVRVGQESVALLWFIGVYLLVLAFVPMLTKLRTFRATAAIVAGLLAASVVVDAIRIAAGTAMAGAANFVIVWLIPVVIGVAYARRLISTRAALLVAVAAFTAQIVAVIVGPYDLSLVVTGTEQMSNVTPPTLLLGLHCTWMSCLFVAAAGAIQRWAMRPRVWQVVAVGNSGAMTLYLWHIPAIAVAMFSLHAVGLDAYDVDAPGFLWLLALRAVVFTLVMAVLFKALSPLEHRPLPWWDAKAAASGVRSRVAGVFVCIAGVAILLLAKNGMGDVAGWVTLGVFVAACAAARFTAATART